MTERTSPQRWGGRWGGRWGWVGRLRAAVRAASRAGSAASRRDSGYEANRITAELATITERRTAFDR